MQHFFFSQCSWGKENTEMASAQQQSMQQWQQVLRRYFKIEGPLLSLAVYADKFLLFNRGHFG